MAAYWRVPRLWGGGGAWATPGIIFHSFTIKPSGGRVINIHEGGGVDKEEEEGGG